MRLDDADLVGRAKTGDAEAFEALVRRHQTIAFRVAYLITGSAAEAEDAAQDAMIKAYVALPRFRDGAPFRPWLLTIVANEARNRRKATARHPALSLDAAAVRPAVSGTDPPETAAIVREHDDTLIRAVNGLGGDDRRVIAFRYFLDLSEAEMAEALGVARGTVKSRLSRALGRVRALLAAEGGGDV